ncbi:hypothetical protein Taro_032038 [Colocasia esculenta]|uniref:Uncharacterized protein n=1 Tax=Colocasia esculenta TaxID=4460 RepID=A0A843W2P5_COLES|nr:hypothetical protein [Colocasia esculenta]
MSGKVAPTGGQHHSLLVNLCTMLQFLTTRATLDRGDLFIRTRMKKSGGPVNDESATIIDKIRDINMTQQSSTSSSIASVGDAYEQVLGRDITVRACGIGTGPTRKSLWGSRSEQKLRQDNESLKQQIDALEERINKIESRGNNEDSLTGRRVRILNFSKQVVTNDILMFDDNDNVVMAKKLGGEYYEVRPSYPKESYVQSPSNNLGFH